MTLDTSKKLTASGYEAASELLSENTALGHSVKLVSLEDEGKFDVLVVFAEGVGRVFVGSGNAPYEVIR